MKQMNKEELFAEVQNLPKLTNSDANVDASPQINETASCDVSHDDINIPTIHSADLTVPPVEVANEETTCDDKASQLDEALTIVEDVLLKVVDDCGAPFETEAVAALSYLKRHDPANFQRIRQRLKTANRSVSLSDLDRLLRETTSDATVQTHHGYASDVIARLTVDDWVPVGFEGSLYIVDPEENVWVKCPIETVIRIVAENHDARDNCERSSDYSGIAQHTIMLAGNDSFFANAPVGLASRDLFYRIESGDIVVEPLSPSHRQRVKVDVVPKNEEMPMFKAFLSETFQSNVADEEEQQVTLVQEIAGAIILGLMAKHHKAVLFYDPFGRAGKGTLERILRELVPISFVTSVSPFNWDREYYLASLSGARLNVVGELPDNKPIPAAAFKTVTGGDLLTGRHPNHRPISFKNEAAHLFMANHFINSSDHSEAFFTRWLLVEFPNSRVRNGKPIDPDLPERIIKAELASIAGWALGGALRLMTNGKFSQSTVHDRLMVQWRRHTNSLEEFIFECCERGAEYTVRRSVLYVRYSLWCKDNGRRPFSKSKVKELLAHNISMQISWASLDGYEIFRGIRLVEEEFHTL